MDKRENFVEQHTYNFLKSSSMRNNAENTVKTAIFEPQNKKRPFSVDDALLGLLYFAEAEAVAQTDEGFSKKKEATSLGDLLD